MLESLRSDQTFSFGGTVEAAQARWLHGWRRWIRPAWPLQRKLARACLLCWRAASRILTLHPASLLQVFDINFLRESEIKHGRIAMLACLGVFVQTVVHLPGEAYTEANPVDAFYKVGPQPLLQIFLFIGFLENKLHDGKISYLDMDVSKPGDFGFDPLKFGKDPANLETLKLKEIKNGRLAMCAIGGLLHQCFVSGSPIWDFSTTQG